jgi:hypothetical protein
MALEPIWRAWRTGGFQAARAVPVQSALDAFYLAILAFAAGQHEPAGDFARSAQRQAPESVLYPQAASYLERVARQGKGEVYSSAEGFAAFVRGGGNLALYRATSSALRDVYRRGQAIRLLDIGVGDGLALLPALTAEIASIDLIEPSSSLLESACRALSERGTEHRAFNEPIQAFIAREQGEWDLAQATFSLQSVPPVDRPALFAWLRDHVKRLLIVEFDVPRFEDQLVPGFARYVVERYQRGIAEYFADRELVAQGFLMPVLFGYFDPTAARTNYEQPIADWTALLSEAGFAEPDFRLLYGYWWAPACLVSAAR